MAISHLGAICIDCSNPHRVSHFWAAVLGYTIHYTDAVLPPDESYRPPSPRGRTTSLV
jgi:hypothetical protein